MKTPSPSPAPLPQSCTAFAAGSRLATGALAEVAVAARHAPADTTVLVFDDATGKVVDLDLRGTDPIIRRRYQPAEVLAEAAETPERGRGRPKLGVVAREVTLLPRHWAWLGAQPGGASVALRKLVETAQRAGADRDRIRLAKEATYRFISAMAGNEPGFEEAVRALFAGNRTRFEAESEAWPADIRNYARRLAADGFAEA
jgi:hypothetical protein